MDMTESMKPVRPPKSRLLPAIVIGISILVIPSLIVFQLLVHRHPAYRTGISLVQQDSDAKKLLGEPIEVARWAYGRSYHGAANFKFRVSGPRGKAEVVLSAEREDASWRIRYILLKPAGGRFISLPSLRGYVVR